jgi:hypothetical protein
MAIDFEVTPGVIEAIERATLQAVRPDVVDTSIPAGCCPWTAAPLVAPTVRYPSLTRKIPAHRPHRPRNCPTLHSVTAPTGCPPVFRLPEDATWLHDAARALGAERVAPTWVMTVPMSTLLQLRPLAYAGNVHISVERLPDPAWQALVTGEGLDPVDGAHRVRLLSRAEQTLFVTARLGDDAVACGAASFWPRLDGCAWHAHRSRPPWTRARGPCVASHGDPCQKAAYGHLIQRMSPQRLLVFSTHFCRWVPPTRLPWRCTAAPALYRSGVTPTGAVSKRSLAWLTAHSGCAV